MKQRLKKWHLHTDCYPNSTGGGGEGGIGVFTISYNKKMSIVY